ncbi:DUF2158 domain-containing protein [Cereibacter azotoformans]|uniref:YodC family protein n=1 Tax=Cereibacter azotoformans TaxID=43057 RepID=UPI001EEB5A12|nr:DUF2158 domain-containing protein [Cereibacter azotoformans]ULB09567.1 DUF2158 domain-containing protein [Cereibacter azotoformans]
MKDEFKPGDIVQLKSGGPAMTVEGRASPGGKYWCDWFKGASRERGAFDEPSLKLYVPPSKA